MIVVSGVMKSYGRSNSSKDLAKKAKQAKAEYRNRFGKEATHINLPKNFGWSKATFAGLIVAKKSMSNGTIVVGHIVENPFSPARLAMKGGE